MTGLAACTSFSPEGLSLEELFTGSADLDASLSVLGGAPSELSLLFSFCNLSNRAFTASLFEVDEPFNLADSLNWRSLTIRSSKSTPTLTARGSGVLSVAAGLDLNFTFSISFVLFLELSKALSSFTVANAEGEFALATELSAAFLAKDFSCNFLCHSGLVSVGVHGVEG